MGEDTHLFSDRQRAAPRCVMASARGYLVRKEVFGAREDFEDILKEIDGGLTHVEWRETVIPIPHFTDTDGPFLRPSSSASKPSNPGLDVCATPQSPSSSSPSSSPAPSSEDRGDLLLEKIEAERDDSQTKAQASLSKDYSPSSSSVRGDGEGQKESTMGEKDGDSTTVWSSVELDMNYGHSHKGPRQYHLAQEVPCTPEALRLHRNTLTMELVWLQQAIDSRKKYLSLKDRLTVS
ncbi:IQ domain-containing protein C isoform X1 [Sebastes umbrosus]|uniref:IQ domain-containing protein C isoform X1 n=1 Tax=Sebastes umbrosus TaxID=72105 RepID=UPI00189EA6A9|nr:IQ domain-containing protein C isoform X1 [Sebastes umbrosus]